MNRLFTLRCRISGGIAIVQAFANPVYPADGRVRIDTKLIWNGEVVFPMGATFCTTAPWWSLDGIQAKELVLSLFCMKPGDTDSEYFDSYTKKQLAWVCTHAEELDIVREDRYCDRATGACRSER